MGLALILAVLLASVDCKWGDYVACGEEKEDGNYEYLEKACGCRKGYRFGVDDNNKEICTKCKNLDNAECENEPAPVAGSIASADLGCYCKDKKWVASSCPANAKDTDDYYATDEGKSRKEYIAKEVKECKKCASYRTKQCMFQGCMPYPGKARCSGVAVWAFIVVIVVAVVVVVAIIVIIIIIILKLKGPSKPTEKVSPTEAGEKDSGATKKQVDITPVESGPYVTIKLGAQQKDTKKNQNATWGEEVQFTGVGAEDDEIDLQVHDQDGVVQGTASLRLPNYVNNKQHVSAAIKNTTGADVGVLDLDVVVNVVESDPPEITGVFFVDKYTKAA